MCKRTFVSLAIHYGNSCKRALLIACACRAVEAMRLGNEAAKFVSAAFPDPMELKFERVAQPFLLLHVNRCLHMLVPHCLGPK